MFNINRIVFVRVITTILGLLFEVLISILIIMVQLCFFLLFVSPWSGIWGEQWQLTVCWCFQGFMQIKLIMAMNILRYRKFSFKPVKIRGNWIIIIKRIFYVLCFWLIGFLPISFFLILYKNSLGNSNKLLGAGIGCS